MIQIVQDYKNWKLARLILKQKTDLFNSYKKNITQNCDVNTWRTNIINEKKFEKSMPETNTFDDLLNVVQLLHTNIAEINKAAQKYHASSCVYKFKDKQNYCINFTLYEKPVASVRCDGCPQYMFLKHLQNLYKDLVKQEEGYEIAKQKLLDNFRLFRKR